MPDERYFSMPSAEVGTAAQCTGDMPKFVAGLAERQRNRRRYCGLNSLTSGHQTFCSFSMKAFV